MKTNIQLVILTCFFTVLTLVFHCEVFARHDKQDLYDVVFDGPTGENINFAEIEESNPHSWIVQGADFDKVWNVRVADVQYEVGFSYRHVKDASGKKRLLVESLVLSYVDEELRVNTAPLAYFFGNRFPYEGIDETPDVEMPPVQSNLSFGSPTSVKIKESKNSFKLKLVFTRPVAQIYSLRESDQWKPPGFKKDVLEYNGLTAEVNIKFSKQNPYQVNIDTALHIAEPIENHNGFNLLTQVVYPSDPSVPVNVHYLGTDQIVVSEFVSKQIKSLQLKSNGWQMLVTEEFDKNPMVFATGSIFQDGWEVTVDKRKVVTTDVPGFGDFAIKKPYIDVEGTSHIPNNLYTFRYNGWYDYLGRGYYFAVIDEDPVVIKATPSETHLGKGWISVNIPAGDYENTVVLDFTKE